VHSPVLKPFCNLAFIRNVHAILKIIHDFATTPTTEIGQDTSCQSEVGDVDSPPSQINQQYFHLTFTCCSQLRTKDLVLFEIFLNICKKGTQCTCSKQKL
jgi:hypothetical protein